MKTLDIAIIGVGAALYAIVGILTNLGIVSPVVGVVKFWPAVIVPGIFAVLFGPLVGGTSAAIGIFISDMVQPGHGIPLLSLTV
ncbi:MAG: ECF transporter S component, partial [Candidatus Bathyarchaeota archaeon]